MDKILKFIDNPAILLRGIIARLPLNWLSDELVLRIYYYSFFNKKLNLNDPKTFNEKLQWLKLNDHNPKYIKMVDKYEVRGYISDKIGEKYLIPLIGIWDNISDININILPDQFVLKTTHDSGGVVICKNKDKLNFENAKKKINKSLSINYYDVFKEWPYKNVKPRIIAEEYLIDSNGELNDYKFFSFNGIIHSVMVCIDRDKKNPKFYFFDEKWNLLRINEQGKRAPENFTIPKPKNLNKMFEIARKLSEGIPHVRIDLYYVNDLIYFGEMTFYSESGFDNNLTHDIDNEWGNLIKLDLVEKVNR